MSDRTLFVGVGSPHGDDRVGWLVADRLRAISPSLAVRKAAQPAEILDWVDGVDRLVIGDACVGAATPGRILRWTWPGVPCDRAWRGGSHGVSVVDALALAERLGRLPSKVEIVGIEVARCEPGGDWSGELASVVSEAARQIVEELGYA